MAGTIGFVNQNQPNERTQKSARGLLEKIAKTTGDETSDLLADLVGLENSLPEHERSFAQAMGWLGGTPNLELLYPENFSSNRLKSFYFASPRCHLSLVQVIEYGLAPGNGAFLKIGKARAAYSQTVELLEVSQFAVRLVVDSLAAEKRKQAEKIIKEIAIGMSLPIAPQDAQLLLESVYAQFDPHKKTTWPKSLVELSLDWLTTPRNYSSLNKALDSSEKLLPASYGNIIMALSRVRVTPASSKYVFIKSLLNNRQKSLVTALGQPGVFDDFSSDDFGILISDIEIHERMLLNQRVMQNLRDAVNRRLKKDDPVDALLATARYPQIVAWSEQQVLARRIRLLNLPIIQQITEEETVAATSKLQNEILSLSAELERSKADAEANIGELRDKLNNAQAAAKSWEDRLRANVNSEKGVRDDELRLAQATVIRELVQFIDDVYRSRGSQDAIVSLVEYRRSELRNFGVRVEGSGGDTVQFDPGKHESSAGIEVGQKCNLDSPVYFVESPVGEIVLRKGTVYPQ